MAEEQLAERPMNKNCNITQVKNGFILYSGVNTQVSYTFEELVTQLKEYFV